MRCCSRCTRPAGAGPPSMPATPSPRRPGSPDSLRRARRSPHAPRAHGLHHGRAGILEPRFRRVARGADSPSRDGIDHRSRAVVRVWTGRRHRHRQRLPGDHARRRIPARPLGRDRHFGERPRRRAGQCRASPRRGSNRVSRDPLPRWRARPVRPDRVEPAVRDRCRVRITRARSPTASHERRWHRARKVWTTSAGCWPPPQRISHPAAACCSRLAISTRMRSRACCSRIRISACSTFDTTCSGFHAWRSSSVRRGAASKSK